MMQTEREVAEIIESKVRRTASISAMQKLRKLVEGIRQEEKTEARAVRILSIFLVVLVLTATIAIAVKWLSARDITRNHSVAKTYAAAALSQITHYANTNYQAGIKTVDAEGQVALQFSIDANGHLKSVKVVRSSGKMALDNMAKNVVEMSGSFPSFPEAMKKDTDIIEITHTFNFVNNELSAKK
jgi:TonB family protein